MYGVDVKNAMVLAVYPVQQTPVGLVFFFCCPYASIPS